MPDTKKKSAGFTAEEKAAMRERARELIAEMPKADRSTAERIHAIVKANAPSLFPKTWYGMPAYANDDGKIVCFYKSADKFKSRYATLGFEDAANLDAGAMWPTSYALTELTPADEKKIAELVKKAAR